MINTSHADNVISHTADINAPLDELFELVSNPQNHANLDGSGSVGEVVSGGSKMRVGEPFVMKMKLFGLIPYRITSTPTRVDTAVVEWKSGPTQVTWRWEMDAITPDSTRVTESWDTSSARVPGLQKILGGMMSRGIQETLKNLQAKYTRVV